MRDGDDNILEELNCFLERKTLAERVCRYLSYEYCGKLDPNSMSTDAINKYIIDFYLKDNNSEDHYNNLIKDLLVFKSFKEDLQFNINNDEFIRNTIYKMFSVPIAMGSIVFAMEKFIKENYKPNFDVLWDYYSVFFIIFIFVIARMYWLSFKRNSPEKKLRSVNQAILILENIKEGIINKNISTLNDNVE